jgi:hypothetical protein
MCINPRCKTKQSTMLLLFPKQTVKRGLVSGQWDDLNEHATARKLIAQTNRELVSESLAQRGFSGACEACTMTTHASVTLISNTNTRL